MHDFIYYTCRSLVRNSFCIDKYLYKCNSENASKFKQKKSDPSFEKFLNTITEALKIMQNWYRKD